MSDSASPRAGGVPRFIKLAAVALSLMLSFTAFGASIAHASPGPHNTAHQTLVKSWTGIPIYRVGEEADYYSNGKAITQWDTAYPWMASYGLWSYSNAKASWPYKSATYSYIKGTADFCLGASTQWVNVCVQKVSDWDYSYAYN
ncbi:MAG: hypothetical protein FWC46_01805 [Actinomycetia bacterium]|nr:hypothetical protein [Actinomycetes bacterium]